MKVAVVTRADSGLREMTQVTFPSLMAYADKLDADFLVLSHNPTIMTEDNRPHYRITRLYELLGIYDRIVHLDCDMLVSPDCPNILEAVPEDKIGSIYEDVGSRAEHRRGLIQGIQREWGDVGWREGYTNAGTFVVSRIHRDIFLPHMRQYWLGWGSVDVHLSYNIHKFGMSVHELSYQWNHMTMFSEPWNHNADRFSSYIIHYAGNGIFDPQIQSRMDQIRSDAERWFGA